MSKPLVPSNFSLTQSSVQAVQIDPKVSRFNPVKSKDDLGFEEFDQKVADMKIKAAVSAHDRGRKSHELRQYGHAIMQFSIAINLAPKIWWQHYDRGLARSNLDLYEEAVNDFSEEIAINSNPIAQTKSLYARGVAFDALGREEEALSDWRKVVKLNQKDDPVFEYSKKRILILDMKIGVELQNQRKWEESVSYFDEAIEISPHEPYLYHRRAISHDQNDQSEKVLHDLNRGIEVMPDDYKEAYLLYISRGFTHDKLGDSENAIKDFDKFFKLRPQGYKEDLYQEVRERYKEISGHEPQPQNDYNLFNIFMSLGIVGGIMLVVVPIIIRIFNDLNRQPPFRKNLEEGYGAIRHFAEIAVSQMTRFENLNEDEKKGLLAIDVNQAGELFNKLMESTTPEKIDQILNKDLASIEDEEKRNNLKNLLKDVIGNCSAFTMPQVVNGGSKSYLYDNMLLNGESERYPMNRKILEKCVTVFNEEVIRLLQEVHSLTHEENAKIAHEENARIAHENAMMASFDMRPSSAVSLDPKEINTNQNGNGKCRE